MRAKTLDVRSRLLCEDEESKRSRSLEARESSCSCVDSHSHTKCISARRYRVYSREGVRAPRRCVVPGRLPLLHQAPMVRLSRRFERVARTARKPFPPIAGAGKSVGPHFECLQTKRCAYLWSARYPCSIFHHLWSRLSVACSTVHKARDTRRHSSSSAPAISTRPLRSRGRRRQVRVTLRGSHSFRGSFSADVAAHPGWTSSGYWAILKAPANTFAGGPREDASDRKVSGLFRELTLLARRFPSSVA